MAVLAVFLLLALVGTQGCEEQQGAPGAPARMPTPAPTSTSTPAAAAAAAAAAATTTEAPPTAAQLPYESPTLSPTSVKRRSQSTMSMDSPLHKYALLNSARLQGRGIVHSQRKIDKDGDRVEFCECDDKLFTDAMQYREYGAFERWCTYLPEDRRVLCSGDDDDDDEETAEEEDSHPVQFVVPTVSSLVRWRGSSLNDIRNGTQVLKPIAVRASTSVTQPFIDRQTQPILAPSSSLPVSSTCNPLSESVALQNFNGLSVFSQLGDNMFNMINMLPSRLPSSASDNQPETNLCEGADRTVVVGTPMQRNQQAITQRRQADNILERGSSLPLPQTPEPQPGPSRRWSDPAPKQHHTSLHDRGSRNRLSAVFSTEAGGGMFGPLNPSDWTPLPPEDLIEELNRIFGPQDYGEEQPAVKYCMGKLTVAMFGSNERPLYTVYVKCHWTSDVCPPATVCSPVVDPFTVTKRKYVPFQQEVFRLLRDGWEPATLQLPTACFCTPTDYKPRQINIFNLPAFT